MSITFLVDLELAHSSETEQSKNMREHKIQPLKIVLREKKILSSKIN